MKADYRSIEFAPGRILTIETGRLAKQANGSVMARVGDTMVLATATAAREARPDAPFFPLTVEFRENFSAGGKFPGGFIKREGRPSDKEILSCRIIDRTIRPLFPDGFMNETQIILGVYSSDGENDSDMIGGVAASIALTLSDIPFFGPTAKVRVGRINGEFIINPTVSELEDSDFDIVVGGTIDSVTMVEGEMHEVSEEQLIEAIKVGHESVAKLCQFQVELQKEYGKEKWDVEDHSHDADLEAKVTKLVGDKYFDIAAKGLSKFEYSDANKAVITDVTEALVAEDEANEERRGEIKEICYGIQKKSLRKLILEKKTRIDGRKPDEIRPIWTEVGYLTRAHGSSIFTRGETQAMVSVTLGTKRDEQAVDTLFNTDAKRFMLNYNFPPFCTGEAKMMRGTSRREIGHGDLAERALKVMMPSIDDFDYTVRVVSDTLESNGSSSMAAVCGGSLALMDAGIPLQKPVAGIAMGMVYDGENTVVLSDIQGEEDFMGDMDFKITGTTDGITACQMDIKVKGISFDIMQRALEQAKAGRQHILDKMGETIKESRTELSQFAPTFLKLEIDTDQIGSVIGPGGKVIQGIQKETDSEIVIEEKNDKGIVTVSADSKEKAEAAIAKIRALTGKLEEGEVYLGTVRSIKEYGAFVELMPGKDGLLHISEIAHERINNVEDVLKEGDQIEVKLLRVENGGKLRLSRKVLLPKED